MKLIKINRKHTGYGIWEYYVERPKWSFDPYKLKENKIIFFKWRLWCWENWGASKEIQHYDSDDLFDNVDCSNSRWAWLADFENGRFRIYFKSAEDASIFTLRWS